MVPTGFRKKVELVVSIPRICCQDCGAVKQIHLPFADPKKHYTRPLERCVIDLCRVMTLQHVAELTGLGWDTVKAIHKQYLRQKYTSMNLKSVRYLAIDEVYRPACHGRETPAPTIHSHGHRPVHSGHPEAGPYRGLFAGGFLTHLVQISFFLKVMVMHCFDDFSCHCGIFFRIMLF
jgi:hypothetical protein